MRKLILAIAILAVAGMAGTAGAQVSTVKSGTVAADETWGGAANPCPILLDGPVVVGDGVDESPPVAGSWTTKVELTILSGCIIRGTPRQGPTAVDAPGSLVVSRTGRINAVGNPANPIIFTTGALDVNGDAIPDRTGGVLDQPTGATPIADFWDDDPANNPRAPLDGAGLSATQLWGGLIILGKAPVNVGNGVVCPAGGVPPSVEGECLIEGLQIPGLVTVEQATYGGGAYPLPHDSSGRLRYVSVRHGGDEVGTANEINGVTMGGVGDGTEVSFVEVYANFDDSFEWFGGTMNADHLVATLVGDDHLDTDQGYTGTVQFTWIVMPWFGEVGGGLFGSDSGDQVHELDGDDFNEANFGSTINCCPASHVWLWNVTAIGSDQVSGGSPGPTAPDFTPAVGDDVGLANNGGPQLRNGFGGVIFNSIYSLTLGAPLIVDSSTNGCQYPDGLGGTISRSTSEQVGACKTKVIATTFAESPAVAAGLATDALTCGNNDERSDCSGAHPAVGLGCNVETGQSFSFNIVQRDTSFDPQGNASGYLDATLKSAGNGPINPRTAGFTGTVGGVVPPNGTLLDRTATYRGAFDSSLATLWVDDWTVLSIAGLID